ncbi:MAG: hypothetical protein CMB80_11760 [Flammeovirgaceae bacterium]|nr:hypothetical protein [Flammeovirgaceae bacterium]MBR10842.1 hypothetical protein [Rickettsiales bacterium]HCX20351.1 hypothetical protein [Cytophagales bacterium]|tara:strand:+ start:98 stop:358 length:261 start_codon:yes stop_codon:yes gene_type:complete
MAIDFFSADMMDVIGKVLGRIYLKYALLKQKEMNIWVKQLFIILLIIAFTPLAFGLMPLLVVIGIIGSIYMIIAASNEQHHHHHFE